MLEEQNIKPTILDLQDISYAKCLNIFLFLFLNTLLVIRTGIYKMLASIANREDPDQTASSEVVSSGFTLLSMPLWQVTSNGNIRTSTIYGLAHENSVLIA